MGSQYTKEYLEWLIEQLELLVLSDEEITAIEEALILSSEKLEARFKQKYFSEERKNEIYARFKEIVNS